MADKASTFGPNDWFVDEKYEQYLRDPQSVSETWREFFADEAGPTAPARPQPAPTPAPASAPPIEAAPAATTPTPAGQPPAGQPPAGKSAPASTPPPAREPAPAAATPDGAATTELPEGAKKLTGVAATVARNMEASLGLPTATSIRPVPAKLLEKNRTVINNYLARHRGGKISFTHIIGFAVVKALGAVPVMNNEFMPAADGRPAAVRRRDHVGLGLAVDQKKADGSRGLVVVCVKDADTMDFRGFWQAYDELIRKVSTNKLSADDFAGVTATLTNPGTIGTEHSVPRLMPGQGVIVGVGAIDFPAEYRGADPQALADLGLSKTVTLTSTYDHRIIQGAESGEFLATIEGYLLGDDGFYDEIFESMGVPYVTLKWSRDVNPVDHELARLKKQMHVQTLVNAYRVRGHLIADLDPLAAKKPTMPAELDPAAYGLTVWDLDREFLTDGLGGREIMTLGDILGVLRDAYCRTVGVEYGHVIEPDQKKWIQRHVEGVPGRPSEEEQRHILDRLNAAEALEKFLETKYIGTKRFGLEGAESAIVVLDTILDAAAADDLPEAVLGMAHRGRLNVLINIVGKSYGDLFAEFEGNLDPNTTQGSGDVKYHKGFKGKFTGLSDLTIDVSLSSNPSHLEAVDPVVEGMARAKQDVLGRAGEHLVLPVLVHGDAAFAGQGVVAETLNMSALQGYTTGGTVHLVINNQLGFTTNPESSRSSVYATDVAKSVQAPIFHVNGDDPEACARVGRLAFEFRQAFNKDVVIDMVCYRRFGHNEQDDPSLTQPQMYERIKARRTVRKLYVESLIRRGDLTMEQAEEALAGFNQRLQLALEQTRSSAPPKLTALPPAPPPAPLQPDVPTGVELEKLQKVATALFEAPEGFHVHPKLQRVFDARAKLWAGGEADWAMGEALAWGTMLLEGHDVRVAGQDTRRGTFGHRNAVLVDVENGSEYVPLANVAPEQGRFSIYDSLLSEYAAMGFEYGYSVVRPDAFVAWEAQFGDFVNGAQLIVDQFLAASLPKWDQTCSLVLLLPHGYEGQGAEHSSARMERFLALAAEDNMIVADVTTAAQLFHLLRRQVQGEHRRPLVLFTPKRYLRAKEAYSPVDAFTTGSFAPVLDDPAVADPAAVRRVVLATGKVALDAMVERGKRGGAPDVAVVRVEQLYPFPEGPIAEVVARYEHATDVVWLQEEPENMGAWSFMQARLAGLLAGDVDLRHVARHESGSPATGSGQVHELEQADILDRALS